jgi:hypothetical protein
MDGRRGGKQGHADGEGEATSIQRHRGGRAENTVSRCEDRAYSIQTIVANAVA